MADEFRLLFSPIEIAGLSLKNRIYHAPVTLNYVDHRSGLPTEALADYYAERARGGVGLIIQGAVDVDPASEYWPVPHTRMYDERIVPVARGITEAVHAHGAKIFVELFHIGQASNTRLHGRPSLAPSAIPSMVAGTTPKAMEREDIERAVAGFARAAVNAREAGYDGVELHATHGYLLEQFLSPFFNHRDDDYGGSLDNRMRLLLEVIDRCRQGVGTDFVLGIRLVGDELLPGGLVLDDTAEIARRVASTGKIDFFDVDVGAHQNYHITMSPMYGAPGFNLPFAAAVREAVDPLPVLCAPGRLVDPHEAERVLRDGQADLVGMARALISDPEWVLKARDGRAEEIRHCVFCNQYTMGNLYKGLPVGCIQNPVAGREKEWGTGTLRPAERRKRIVVVGGGPAGMEVARVARRRGHQVTLYEKEAELGGQVLLAARLPRRDEIGGVVRWLAREIERSGVAIRLGTAVTADEVAALGADTVVVATGAGFARSGLSALLPAPIPGSDTSAAVTPEMILRGEVDPGPAVVLLDTEGREIAPGLAELVAARGMKATIVTAYPFVAPKLAEEVNLPHVYGRLFELGVEMVPNSWAKEIRRGEVVVFNVYAPTQERTLPASHVVMVAARRPSDELYLALKSRVTELYRVGDCVTPGDIGTAMLDAHRLGRSL
jgi:mycofactocin system FadH/OYE family oxidoreductase 2